MSRFQKGILVAALHAALVAGLGAKLLVDRARLPRGWAKAEILYPNLPISGRYLELKLVFPAQDFAKTQVDGSARLIVQNGELTAIPSASASGRPVRLERRGERTVVLLTESVAFFIPKHAQDPSHRLPDEELWAEVTVPRKGPPRPIRLGVKKGTMLDPLPLL